jgi:hypothetical protein
MTDGTVNKWVDGDNHPLSNSEPRIRENDMRILKLLTTAGLMAILSGCIIVTDRDDFDWDDSDDSGGWQQQQRDNREAIAALDLGASLESVRSRLGQPSFSEAVSKDGTDFLILRYRTHHRHSDGDTSIDETTALVFKQGVLAGWGDSAMKSLGL